LQLFDLETNYRDARCVICLTLQHRAVLIPAKVPQTVSPESQSLTSPVGVRREVGAARPANSAHPSRSEVNTFMATHWLIVRRLTPKKRRTFQWTTIVVEGLCISNNKRIGLSMNF
jgi:hypothetical protein